MSEALDALGNPTPTPSPTPTPTPTPTPAPSVPEWMNGFADDLRNDPDITRYQTVEDLAKGMKETRAWARGRIPIPADDTGWQELGAKLRPENADGYKIDLPEGDSGELATAYKQFAFDQGIPPRWAEATAAFWGRQQAEMASRLQSQNQAEVQALDLELGTHGFNVRAEAVSNMFRNLGVEDFDAVKALEQVHGAGKTLKVLFALAEKTGELEKVDGASVALRGGNMQPQAAQQEINRLMDDKDFMAKAQVAGSPEHTKWKALNKAASGTT